MNLSTILDLSYTIPQGQKLEDNELVKKWTNCPDESMNNELIIDAYLSRDLHFFPNKTVTEIFERHLSKLGYDLSNQELLNRRKYNFINLLKRMMDEEVKSTEPFNELYNKYVNIELTNVEQVHKAKALKIYDMIEQGCHPKKYLL